MGKLLNYIFALVGLLLLIPPSFLVYKYIEFVINTMLNKTTDEFKLGYFILTDVMILFAIMGFGFLILAMLSDRKVEK